MKTHLIDTHLQVPRSRSSAKVKVKYQGHVSQKMGVSGALVFHKHILSDFDFFHYPAPAAQCCTCMQCSCPLTQFISNIDNRELISFIKERLFKYGKINIPFHRKV